MAEPRGDDNGRSVLLVGSRTPLGARLRAFLEQAPFVRHLDTVELERGPVVARAPNGQELTHRDLCDRLREHDVDTIVHCAVCADRGGDVRKPSGADVIGTMRVCAVACEPTLRVRSLVLASSSAAYRPQSHAGLLRRETEASDSDGDADDRDRVLEAESYARDVAERWPHLSVAILRLADLAGPGVTGPLAALFAGARVPSVPGFDPALQFLHADDAVQALAFAAEVELPGLYNVASRGQFRPGEAAAILGRGRRYLLPFETGPLEPVLSGLGLPPVPDGMLDLLRFGRVLDTRKLSDAGFTPKHDQSAALRAIARRS